MVIALIFCAAMAVMLWAPETPIAGALHRWLVAMPAARLSRISRGQWVIAGAALIGVALVVTIFEQDGMMLLSIGSPELLPVLASLELSAYVDVLTGLAMVAMAAQFGAMTMTMKAAARGVAGRIERLLGLGTRSRTPHRHRPSATQEAGDDGANDNDDDRTALRAAA